MDARCATELPTPCQETRFWYVAALCRCQYAIMSFLCLQSFPCSVDGVRMPWSRNNGVANGKHVAALSRERRSAGQKRVRILHAREHNICIYLAAHRVISGHATA